MSLVNVHNEWDPVEEIIVGTSLYANFPGKGDELFGFDFSIVESNDKKYNTTLPLIFPEKIINETEEDISIFVQELEKLNIVVKRPNPINFKNKIRTLDWESEHFFCYCPRDLLLAVGDLIIECPSGFRSRYFETFSYQEILLNYMKSGARWISAPKPRLLSSSYDFSGKKKSILNEQEPIFDAANIIRAGTDIFYLVSISGNELGGHWLQSVLGNDYRVHFCRDVYQYAHIDTTICFLRPGLALINPEVNQDYLPPTLKKWDLITCPEMIENDYSDIQPICSKWLGMNLLMLSPELAVVDQNQKALIKLLEKNKIDVLPVLLRHGRILGGGPHCITLDVRRRGKLENYF